MYLLAPVRTYAHVFIGLLIVAMAVGWCMWVSLPPQPPPKLPVSGMNKANFRRIQIGMTAEEVESILGRPPGTENVELPNGFVGGARASEAKLASGKEPERYVDWRIRDGIGFIHIRVGLDDVDRVVGAQYCRWGLRWREDLEGDEARLWSLPDEGPFLKRFPTFPRF
jgi:hypothetical protein